jgi:predicted permease
MTELALSFALLVGAGLLIKTYRRLTGTDLGFQEHGILSARITLPDAEYQPERAAVFYQQLFQRLRALPGVESVGSAQGIPFSGWNVQGQMMVEGRPPHRAGDELNVLFQWITPGFFPTIGVDIVAGRGLLETDRDPKNPVGVINQTLARHEFPGSDPIGKRIRGGDESSGAPWVTIVGVARDYHHYLLPQPVGNAIYLPYFSDPGGTQTVVLRTKLPDPHRLEAGLRRTVKEMDPNVPHYSVQTFEEVVSRSLWRQRLQGQTLGIFAGLALILATVGIYGVISYSVAQRTRELGVRMALGATARDVRRLVIRQGLRLAAGGLGIGLLLAIGAGRILRSLVEGVEPADPLILAGVLGLLLFTAVLASWVPARRAATVDPLLAMRAE